MPTQDPAQSILAAASSLSNSQRADLWDVFHNSASQDDLAKTLQGMNIPQEVKASLWDAKHAMSSDVVAPPPPVKAEQPGFFQRLGQSFGLPTSQAEAEAQAPTSIADVLRQAASASTNMLPALVNYGRTAAKGISEGRQDIDEAAANIGQGGPVLSNIGKAVSAAVHASLQATPIVGPTLDTYGNDISQGNYAGAAGGATGLVAQAIAPKVIEGVTKVPGKVGDFVKDNFVEPKPNTPLPELEKPVATPVQVDSSFDDAVIRKTSGKDLSPDARETLRNAAGPVIPAGSSPELHLLKAVPEVNATIATEGTKLAKILADNGPLSTTPAASVTSALDNLRDSLPGGTEESFGKAIDKEATKAKDVLSSTDPVAINDYIRQLDKSISSYTAPEDGIDTASNAADAARVTIRRALRDTINSEIPATKPINTVLGNNIEVRSVLRKRLGAVADDPSAAQSQYISELRKGQDQLARDTANKSIAEELAARKAKVSRNKAVAKAVIGGGGAALVGEKVLRSLVP
jgi:hypothetical protein